MKKFLVFMFLMLIVSVTASARKSYIVLTNDYDNSIGWSYLSGDVPNNIEGAQYSSEYHYWVIKQISPGEILNVLSGYGYGYEVESITNHNSSNRTLYLLSKEIPSNQTISKGDVNTDGEVNIADVNEVINLILGYVREHPEILEQIKK